MYDWWLPCTPFCSWSLPSRPRCPSDQMDWHNNQILYMYTFWRLGPKFALVWLLCVAYFIKRTLLRSYLQFFKTVQCFKKGKKNSVLGASLVCQEARAVKLSKNVFYWLRYDKIRLTNPEKTINSNVFYLLIYDNIHMSNKSWKNIKFTVRENSKS
jgi:hypothetical protein